MSRFVFFNYINFIMNHLVIVIVIVLVIVFVIEKLLCKCFFITAGNMLSNKTLSFARKY